MREQNKHLVLLGHFMLHKKASQVLSHLIFVMTIPLIAIILDNSFLEI